jgi:putative transcriptional regulator
MAFLRGRLVLAAPRLLDPNFFRSVVLIVEHDEQDGAIGLVLNRPTDLLVQDVLPEWSDVTSEPGAVFAGGPVAPAAALALGRGPGDDAVVADLRLVDLEAPPTEWRDVRIFAGYSGWSAGQLEAEIDEDAWLVLPALADDVCSEAPDELWSAVLRRQPGRLALLARYPDEPAFN